MRVRRERLSVCVCVSFPFGFEGGMWDLIVLIPDRCVSVYFATILFHLLLFSAALMKLVRSIPVHSLILAFHRFYYLPLLFPLTMPCRIVFAKPEDLETSLKHLSFRF